MLNNDFLEQNEAISKSGDRYVIRKSWEIWHYANCQVGNIQMCERQPSIAFIKQVIKVVYVPYSLSQHCVIILKQ